MEFLWKKGFIKNSEDSNQKSIGMPGGYKASEDKGYL